MEQMKASIAECTKLGATIKKIFVLYAANFPIENILPCQAYKYAKQHGHLVPRYHSEQMEWKAKLHALSSACTPLFTLFAALAMRLAS
jgi:hypothetical protein